VCSSGSASRSQGIVYLVGLDAIDLGGAHLAGDLLVTANSIAYAFYLVLVRDYVAKHGGLPVVTWGFACAALYALPFGVPALAASAASVPAATWLWTLYVIAIPTVFTYLANAWALRFATSSTVAIWIFIQPTFAALLAWRYLGETPSARLFVAAILVIAGITIVTRAPQPQR
jgi:drug/metabolite transporter (DMT)-like permease